MIKDRLIDLINETLIELRYNQDDKEEFLERLRRDVCMTKPDKRRGGEYVIDLDGVEPVIRSRFQ